MPEAPNSEPFPPANALTVLPEEAGMKLLRFLERRLGKNAHGTALHKWIRTGQVRVNGKRTKPFILLETDDIIRIPPFAEAGKPELFTSSAAPDLDILKTAGINIISHTPHLLVVNKPAGLPTQPGTGQQSSLSQLLAKAWSGAAYIPAPAHRLDKNTSGLVVSGLDHMSQKALHEAFNKNASGTSKYYLAGAAGVFSSPAGEPVILFDYLTKTTLPRKENREAPDMEGMTALPGGLTIPLDATGKKPSELSEVKTAFADRCGNAALPALAAAIPLYTLSGQIGAVKEVTLLLIRLITGRTHQIRVQLASRGHPLVGDGRYGGPAFSNMLLHAWRIVFSKELAQNMGLIAEVNGSNDPEEGIALSCLPQWPVNFMPKEELLESSFRLLQRASNEIALIHV